MTDSLLTANQLAERWQVPKSHVRAHPRGAIPTAKLGGYYRYRLDVMERFEIGRDGGGTDTREAAQDAAGRQAGQRGRHLARAASAENRAG